jgi:hypothetical protein
MRQIRRFSLSILALAIATTATSTVWAPSQAAAQTTRHHRATHSTAPRAPAASYRQYRTEPANAYGAMPGGASYPGYGYGYGDNSHGCSACN